MESNAIERQRWNDARWTEVWPRRERMTDAVTPVLVDTLALKHGERVLDVGAGGGRAALRAAGVVGDEGRVVGADISAPMCQLARTRAAEAGVANVTFGVVDAQVDHIDGGPFDVAMSQFGVMFFDEPRTAFANIRSVLRPGGRLGFACWQAIDQNPWFFGPALAGLVPAPPAPGPGKSPTGPFALADPDRVTEILEAAGFIDVAVLPYRETIEVPEDSIVDDDQLMFNGVPADHMAAAHDAVSQRLAPLRQPSGLLRIPLAYQVVTANNDGRPA